MKKRNAPPSGSLKGYLLAHYGPTLGYEELADLLGTSVNALRLRQARHADLPPSIPHMSKKTWAVPAIVAWLSGEQVGATSRAVRRGGRPRNQPRGGTQ